MGTITRVSDLRDYLIDSITSFLKERGVTNLEAVDIDEGNSPIVHEDLHDPDATYTLDRIEVEDGKVYVDASSMYLNAGFELDELYAENLENILDWLFEYEDEINKIATSKE